jgi:Uma2 family endonuclease
MATAARHSERMTIEEFLEWDSGDELRYELVDGVPTAMNPPMAPHARLVALLTGAIERRLRPPCGTYVGGGARRQDDNGNYRIPDLSISCSRSPGHWIEAPQVVIEILSPSTARKDLSVKLPFYRSMPSVEEILLVRTDRRHVEQWQREVEDWRVRDLIGSAEIAIRLLSGPIPLDEIYAPLELEAEPDSLT